MISQGKVSDKRFLGKKYKDVFIGYDAVNVLIDLFQLPSRKEAVDLGHRMLLGGLLEHVVKQHTFKDEHLFYKFNVVPSQPVSPTPTVSQTKTKTRRFSLAAGDKEASATRTDPTRRVIEYSKSVASTMRKRDRDEITVVPEDTPFHRNSVQHAAPEMDPTIADREESTQSKHSKLLLAMLKPAGISLLVVITGWLCGALAQFFLCFGIVAFLMRSAEANASQPRNQTGPESPLLAAGNKSADSYDSAELFTAAGSPKYMWRTHDNLTLNAFSDTVLGQVAALLQSSNLTQPPAALDRQLWEAFLGPPPDSHKTFGFTICKRGAPDKFVGMSDALRSWTGYGKEEILQKPVSLLYGKATLTSTIEVFYRAVERQEPLSLRLQLHKSDSSPFWSCMVMVPLRDPEPGLYLVLHCVPEVGSTPPELLLPPRAKYQPTPDAPTYGAEILQNVEVVRNALRQEFPDQSLDYFDDDYLRYALAKNNRTVDYVLGKARETMKWRIANRVDEVREQDAASGLQTSQLFWHGFDRARRPVFYLRPGCQDMKRYDTQQLWLTHIVLLERGLRLLPPGACTFHIVMDARGAGLQHFDRPLAQKVLAGAATGYRDRVEKIVAGPVSYVVSGVWKFCKPLMSENLSSKVTITNTPKQGVQEHMQVSDVPDGLFAK